MDRITKKSLPSPTWRWLGVNDINIIDFPRKSEKVDIAVGENKFLVFDHKEENHITINDLKGTIAENGQLTIVTVGRLPKDCDLYFNYDFELQKNAKLNVIQVFIGGKETFGSVKATLTGTGSGLDIRSAYLQGENQLLDLNYVAEHFGSNTESAMHTNGVLYKGSQKILRGTIDFKRGAKGAVGNETEDVLMMDDDVINKSVPVILCAEEDVEGNHGATIGKINDELLFYMTSRGLSKEQIYDMLAKARIEMVAKLIPDEELRNEVLELI